MVCSHETGKLRGLVAGGVIVPSPRLAPERARDHRRVFSSDGPMLIRHVRMTDRNCGP
jgi:hypothetical protein